MRAFADHDGRQQAGRSVSAHHLRLGAGTTNGGRVRLRPVPILRPHDHSHDELWRDQIYIERALLAEELVEFGVDLHLGWHDFNLKRQLKTAAATALAEFCRIFLGKADDEHPGYAGAVKAGGAGPLTAKFCIQNASDNPSPARRAVELHRTCQQALQLVDEGDDPRFQTGGIRAQQSDGQTALAGMFALFSHAAEQARPVVMAS